MNLIIKNFNRINWGYAIAFILLIAGFVFSSIISTNLYKESNRISQTDSTMNRLSELFTSLKSAQASWGEYTLTKSYKSLNQYYDKTREIDSLFGNIYQSSLISLPLKGQMDTLANLLNSLHTKDHINPILHYRKNAAILLDSLQMMSARNSLVVDSITTIINGISREVKAEADERSRTMGTWSIFLEILGYAMLLVAVFLAVHMLIIYRKERAAKKKARGDADNYQQQLEARIEELMEMNKEILRLKSMEKYTSLGRVATIIAHDIKNPLTSINVALEELRKALPERRWELYFNIIRRSSNKINEKINHFLNVTAFTKLNTQVYSINQLLDTVLMEAEDRICLENITVVKNYEKDICEVSVDIEKIKTAFLNLIFNAIEAMNGDKKVLTITTLTKKIRVSLLLKIMETEWMRKRPQKYLSPILQQSLKTEVA